MKTIALILGLLSFIRLSSTLSQIPANGLVAYYPFSGNANDMSGNTPKKLSDWGFEVIETTAAKKTPAP